MSTGKRVDIKPRPTGAYQSADEWVEQREKPSPAVRAEPIKRLTLDIPESLHREIKAQCASRGVKMVDELREMLIKKYRNA